MPSQAARRGSSVRWNLPGGRSVTGAAHEHGMLHIDLVREVPEAMKPRRIEIGRPTATETPAIEAQSVEV